MARAGLKKVIKTVKGKRGSVKRSYWIKSDPKAGKGGKQRPGFLRRHAGKILGLAALAGGAYLAHKAGGTAAVRGAATHGRAAYKDAMAQRGLSGPKLGIRERLSGAAAAASHGARQGVAEHHERQGANVMAGKEGRIGAMLSGAYHSRAAGGSARDGARRGLDARQQAQNHGAYTYKANQHAANAAGHRAKQQRALSEKRGLIRDVANNYHKVRARISERKSARYQARANRE